MEQAGTTAELLTRNRPVSDLSTGQDYRISGRATDVCPFCGGTGKRPYVVDIPEYGPVTFAEVPCRFCDSETRIRAEQIRERAGIPYDVTLADFDWGIYPEADLSEQRTLVSSFIFDHNRFYDVSKHRFGLFIGSPVCGAGKTYLASAIAGEFIRAYGREVVFTTEAQLLSVTDRERGGIRRYQDAYLLVVDDLGALQWNQRSLGDILFSIVDSRYLARKPTVFTSNHSPATLPFGDRITSRIGRMCTFVQLPGVNVRAIEAE